MYRPIVDRHSFGRGTAFLMRRQRPQIQQCFHHWATDVLVRYVREKLPSTSAFFFFFFSSRQLLRFDFNAFCVVLYFHAKILLYLNVFILLNVLKKFWLLYPRIAVIIHVAVSNFFLWKRSEKREENTKHFLQQCWLIYICKCEVCFYKPFVWNSFWNVCLCKEAEELWYFFLSFT